MFHESILAGIAPKALALAAMLWAAPAPAGPPPATQPAPRARVGVYYFEGWAGKHKLAGKAPWAKNAPTHLTERMLREFPEREPIWGWRDDRQEVMDRQIDWAAKSGIDFFSFCWYWSKDPKTIREDPKHVCLELYLKAKNRSRLRFCLMIANHQGFLFSGPDDWKKAFALWLPYLKHERYVTVAGKPLLIVFNVPNGDKAGFASRRATRIARGTTSCPGGSRDWRPTSTRS